MIVGAVAAPAAGAGAEAIAGLFLILSFVVLIGLQQVWKSSLGWLFHKIADLIDVEIALPHVASVQPFGFAARALRAASDNIYAALGWAALKCEHGAVWLFAHAWQMIKWTGEEIAALATDTYHALDRTITVEIPAAVGAATRPLAKRIHGIDRTLSRLDHFVHERLRLLARGIDRLTHVVTRTIPHQIAAVGARVGHVAGQIRPLSRRLARVERRLGTKAFTAAVATALAALGLNWLRCRNVGKAGKALCGTPLHLLEDVLGLLADFFVLTNICAVIPWMETAFEQIASPLIETLGGAGAGLCNKDYARSPRLDPPDLHLPAVGLSLHLPG